MFGTQANYASWYSAYTNYPFFADRAALIKGRFANTSVKLLVAGCGWGYLLKTLSDLGYTDVWGCDGPWCVSQAATVLPANLAARVINADITNRTSLTALKATAGLSGNQKFAGIITEDVLPCLDTDANVQTALTELRRIGSSMGHIITCADGDGQRGSDMIWHTSAEWKALIGVTSEWILNTETGGLM